MAEGLATCCARPAAARVETRSRSPCGAPARACPPPPDLTLLLAGGQRPAPDSPAREEVRSNVRLLWMKSGHLRDRPLHRHVELDPVSDLRLLKDGRRRGEGHGHRRPVHV